MQLIDFNACNFIKKEALAHVFSSEVCEIFKITFLHRTPLVAASVDSPLNMLQWHCLYILVLMKGRKWQVIKRLKICLNEECLRHWTTCLEQTSEFILTVCSYHVTCAFSNESTLCSCLYVTRNASFETGAMSQNATGLEPTWFQSRCNFIFSSWVIIFRTILDHLGIVNFYG